MMLEKIKCHACKFLKYVGDSCPECKRRNNKQEAEPTDRKVETLEFLKKNNWSGIIREKVEPDNRLQDFLTREAEEKTKGILRCPKCGLHGCICQVSLNEWV